MAYRPLHDLLTASADRAADRVALTHGQRELSYGDLERGSNRLAHLLRDRGVRRGDRVALLAENGLDYVAGYFGILKSGACCVALNGQNRLPTNRMMLADSGAVGLVASRSQVRTMLPDLVADRAGLRFVHTDSGDAAWTLPARITASDDRELDGFSEQPPAVSVGEDDLCTILYTSGSTGTPRGVTLTHRNLAANTQQILAYLPVRADDSVLVVLPFHYSYGKSLLLTHVAVGGRLVVDNRFAYPQSVLQTMSEERITSFAGVPSTYAILCARTEFLSRDLPHLRYLTQAGGAMSPALTRRLLDALPARVRLYVMYGQTEASARLAYVPPDRLPEKIGSIGVAIPDVELRVRRSDGSECDPGETGELVARGANIMRGYWNDPAETDLVLADGALHTGDLGRCDEDGFITIVDRAKNMIKAGANRVSAKEIEDVIAELAGVVEVSVIGVPDALLGEAIEAFVVPAEPESLGEQAILAHCRERLALYKLPRTIHFIGSLPKTAAGKVVKAELAKRADR
jgi:long-chain acyl-CoA synthetase